MKKLSYLLLLVLMLTTKNAVASPYFFFKKYMAADGLSHNTVLCGMQDSYGFIWLGTNNGLNCYDGSSNIVYRNMLNEDFSFENNFVISLFEEGHDIWLGANYGLYVYNRLSNKFSRFTTATRYGVVISSEVRKIVKARNGLIWICTLGQGLFIYNPHNKLLYQNSLHASFICDACQGDDGNMYLSSMQGELLCFKANGQYLKSYNIPNYTGIKDVNCLKNINGGIWMGTSNGLFLLDKATHKLNKFDSNIYFGSIHCLLRYSNQDLLVGTDKGLYLFNQITKLYQRMDNPSDSRSLSDQTVNAMMWDRAGSLWVMTNMGGVNYMSRQSTLFNFYTLDKTNDTTSKKIVGPLCEMPGGNVWIGTQNGLYFYNRHTKQILPYRNGSLNYDIRSIMLDGNRLWLGTYANGIRVIDLKTNSIKAYTYSKDIPYTICSNDVYCIYKTKKGIIYVGTSWGLCTYDSHKDRFMTITTMSSMTSIADIQEDALHNLWVATSNCGVQYMDIKTGGWKHYSFEKGNPHSIPSNSVICIFKDSQNRMWFGTNGGGICLFDAKINGFINFDPNNSILPNSVIYAIEEDHQNNFWITSNAGLTRINPITKSDMQQYTVGNDLWGGQFSQHSSLFTKQGEMLFGSLDGFYSFSPQKLTEKNNNTPIYITSISFPYLTNGDKEKERLHLDKPLYMEREIELPYEDNSFSIHFTTPRYGDHSKIRYSYMMKGVDKQWAQGTESNVATYSNLSPGRYEFRVKESNNIGDSNGKTTSLWIVVTPPWYRSNLAYFIYFILFIVACYYAVKKVQSAIRNKYNRQMEEYQMKQEQESYKSKITFFVNLMHEIRTPLSLISLPLEKMNEEKQNEKNEKYISIIHKNLDYLLDVTNQLLDFQKVENGSLTLNMKGCDVNHLLQNIYEQFSGYAKLKDQTLLLTVCEKRIISRIDKDKITKILVNLIGNAMKYAHSIIELKLEETTNSYKISVCDDGPGIPDSEKEKIFETFYQLHNDKIAAAMGSGIGLSFAKLLAEAHHGNLSIADNIGGGSQFILTLPLVKGEVEEEQLAMREVRLTDDKEEDQQQAEAKKKFTILLTEDNIELLNMTYDSLSQWFNVLKAHNGREALDKLRDNDVDVILSDVMMPEMDGLQLCNKVKSDINYSHIPVILLTAKTALESKVEGMESGADAYIEKPFSIRQVHLQIENLLRLRQAFYKLMTSIENTGTSSSLATSDYGLTEKDCKFTEKLHELLAERMADEGFSIDSLAVELNMSRSSFYRKIKALSGLSPSDYLKTVRMNKAAELLKHGERISDVAAQVGFNSSSYFAKCFKAQFGVVPTDFLPSSKD